MALTLVATPGATNANSYCTRAEADTYFEGSVYSTAWDAASTAEKDKALVNATRLLDELYTWHEWPSSPTQALQWPRIGLMDALYLSILADTEIPPKLKEATAELAQDVLEADLNAELPQVQQGLTSMSAGPVSFGFKDTITVSVIAKSVSTKIPKWWGCLRGGDLVRPVLRG